MALRWLRRRHGDEPSPSKSGSRPDAGDSSEIDPADLDELFFVPKWLRGAGQNSWLLVGIALFLVGLIWLLALTQVIVLPVLTAAIVAAVASPLVAWLERHGVSRGLGSALLIVVMILIAVGMTLVVVGGITAQADAVGSQLSDAQDKIAGWLHDLGVDSGKAEDTAQDAGTTSADSASALLSGVAGGLSKLSSTVFFLAMTLLSLIFLLKDGPTIRTWTEQHLGVPPSIAKTITGRVLGSLRGYFLGTTIVAAFNAAVVALGAWVLGVPLIGTIAAVTFIGAYIPYIGAWTAGAFAVLVALGGAGTEAASGMIVLQLLANSVLQQFVQPLAMGAALGIHPLAVLIVTIAGGALFGTVGLILAAPLTSAVVRISGDLARARAQADGTPRDRGPAASPAGA